MNLINAIRGRIHRPHDERARAQGLTVEELPKGRRRVSDPRLPEMFERRRRRLLREGLSPLDRALMDPATAELFAQTARRMAAETGRVGKRRQAPAARS